MSISAMVLGSILLPLIGSVNPARAYPDPYGRQRNPYGTQRQYQRNQGWSSGDYFGSPMPQQNNYNQRPSNYRPGLNNNLRYTPNDCAVYVNC
tara:strand:+ start:218 stop:496 length:279 start_codon:yes stop_codon:yes gene_type:complete